MPKKYKVGKGKPPKSTQFKKGQSGNPKGRPKGSFNLQTIINKVLNEKVEITINGRKRKITKIEAVLTQQLNMAAKDPKAFRDIMQVAYKVNEKQLGEFSKEPLPWNDEE